MDIPIACRLGPQEARSQITEWDGLLTDAVTRRRRVAPGRLDLHLRPDFDQVDALVRLARREATCCAFFTFSLSIEPEALTLVIEVPDEAGSILDELGPGR